MSNINSELSILNSSKNQINDNIIVLENKKSQIQGSLSVISPLSQNDIEIKQQEIEKQIITLRKESKSTEYKLQLELGTISQDEYSRQINKLEIDTNNELKLVDDRINTLKTQKQSTDPYKRLKNKHLINQKNKDTILNEIRTRRSNAISSIGGLILSTSITAMSAALSKVVYSQMTKSNFQVGKLEQLVDDTNTQIDSIQTKDDIQKANIARNNALRVLNDLDSKLKSLSRILKILSKIASILAIVIKVLKVVAAFVFLPGPKALIQIKLNKFEQILSAVQVVLAIANSIVDTLINLVDELRNRLKTLGSLIDTLATNQNTLSSDDISNLIASSNSGMLGLLNSTYKGFRFVLKEENNPQFVVQGHKRHYAVALNLDNSEILKTESSFTLDPDVLVEELELIIDEKGLTP